MLVPAILYKDQIQKEFQKYYYTTDMMYETGCLDNWNPNICENKLSAINSIKARKESERLLKEVINEYGYILEKKIRGEDS